MISSIKEVVRLHNGVEIPQLGYGVFKVENGSQTVESVKKALDFGYRLIDTATVYENEEGVGQAIRECGIPREEIFVTTKVWNTDQGYESTLAAFDTSLKKLGLDYLDLYLIHWPGVDKYLDTWKAFETLYKAGKVRAIGVSNFLVPHLENLLKFAEIKPVVNQLEVHPYLTQEELRRYCQQHDIRIEAYSPLGRGNVVENSTIATIAKKHGKTAAQVILRWQLQHGHVVIPKSVTPARIKENANLFDFVLNSAEMNEIDQLNKNQRYGSHPDQWVF